jgi:hypothetical protein
MQMPWSFEAFNLLSICWYTLPPLEHIVANLKKKYDNARPMLGSIPLGLTRKRWKRPDLDEEHQSLVNVE